MIELPISAGLGAVRSLAVASVGLRVGGIGRSSSCLRTPRTPFSDARAVHYRLLVENLGGRSAQDCRLQIVGLLFAESGVWKRLTGWEPVDLIWSNRPGVSSIDLAARENAFCDVGHVFSNYIQSNRVRPTTVRELGRRPRQQQALFFLDGRSIPAAQRNALAAGVYALHMRMFSSNVKARDFICLLHFKGEFASLVDESPTALFSGLSDDLPIRTRFRV